MIIIDSSPLIHLARIGKMQFVLSLFERVTIAGSVFDEVITKGIEKGFHDAKVLKEYHVQRKILVKHKESEMKEIKALLHAGEYESIVLAKENDALLIIDEKKGRLFAEQNGIEVLSTAGMLLYLREHGVIDYALYSSNLSKYSGQGWFSLELFQKYLQNGEKNE